MKKIGYLLITFSFLAGSLAAVIDELNVQWCYFLATIIIGVIGIVLVHRHEWKNSRSGKKLTMNLQDIKASLTRVVENLTRLNTEKQSINPYDMHHRIDELFSDDLTTFVEARESLAHVHSLQVYADVMSHFASGERYLNRVWSASADGYVDEITAYLDKAQMQFTEALDKVCQLKDSKD